MRMKYYLKGLGIGIILATLLMGIVMKSPNAMSDEEIKARAKELGMVEPKTLSDVREDMPNAPTNAPIEDEKPLNTEIPVVTDAPVVTEAPVEKETHIVTEPPAETEIPTEEPVQSEPQIIVFEINKGESSDSIAKRLQEQGIINNAEVYNNYLCDNGYDRKLNIGTYQLEIGMTEDEITKIITRTR